MAKKAKGGGVKRERRALKKRTERKRKQRRARQIKAEEAAAKNPRRILRGARRMPTVGAWAQNGWQDTIIARISVAREMSAGEVLFAEYLIDTRCLGVRDSRGYTGVPADELETRILPERYAADPPIKISDELANEIIWGAVEYAESLGFAPHRGFRETQFAIEPADDLPRAAGLEFGYEGKPLFVPLPIDTLSQAFVIKTLIDSVGLGNFYYQTIDGEVPDEVAELLGDAFGATIGDSELDVEEPPLWTPGDVDAATGLWIPGSDADAGEDDDDSPAAGAERERPSESGVLWTPGRD